MEIQCTTFKPNTILQAFKKSGIKPLNPNIFSDYDFAPSIATSTAVHVPFSFPISRLFAMPTSDVFGELDNESAVKSEDDDDNDYNKSDESSDLDASSSDSDNNCDEDPLMPSSCPLSAI
jgi:hypothetical protein